MTTDHTLNTEEVPDCCPDSSVSHAQKLWFWFGVTVLAAVLVGLTAVAKRSVAPPPQVERLEEFARAMPAPTRLVTAQRGGQHYLVWYGKLMHFLALPSGPACYVFDEHGRLVLWSSETGESTAVDQWLEDAELGPDITLPEALARFSPDRQ